MNNRNLWAAMPEMQAVIKPRRAGATQGVRKETRIERHWRLIRRYESCS
jgi:hypothetical protein